eukprot:816495-Pleurochrysis_carterae.AAC.7
MLCSTTRMMMPNVLLRPFGWAQPHITCFYSLAHYLHDRSLCVLTEFSCEPFLPRLKIVYCASCGLRQHRCPSKPLSIELFERIGGPPPPHA